VQFTEDENKPKGSHARFVGDINRLKELENGDCVVSDIKRVSTLYNPGIRYHFVYCMDKVERVWKPTRRRNMVGVC
jgi:hypothetical protein